MKRIRVRHHSSFSEIQALANEGEGGSRQYEDPPSAGYADLAYRTVGTGPEKVVLISGMCVSHEMWQFQESYFRTKPMYTLLLLDNRGSGESSDSTQCLTNPSSSPSLSPSPNLNGYTIDVMARDVWAVVDAAFGSEVHVHLVGHSMGSMIAQRAALSQTHGRRVTSLALLCGHDGGWFWNSAPSIGLVRAALTLLFDKCPYAQADAYLNLHFTHDYLRQDNGKRRDQLLKRYVDGLTSQPHDQRHDNSVWDHFMAVRTHSLSPADASNLRDRPYPKLVLYGSCDPVVMPRASRQLAGRIGAKGIAVHASHFAMEEAKHEINRALELHIVGAAILRHVAIAAGSDGNIVYNSKTNNNNSNSNINNNNSSSGSGNDPVGTYRAQLHIKNFKSGQGSKSREASPVSIQVVNSTEESDSKLNLELIS